MEKTINWNKIWNDFSDWLCKREDAGQCKHCGSSSGCFPDWEDQQDKIKQLVDIQVREILEKKT